MTDQPEQDNTEVIAAGPEHSGLRGSWNRQPARARAVVAAATVGVLAVGGTVAYAAASGGSDGANPAAASSSPSSSASSDGKRAWPGPRGGAVHGEETVKDSQSGKWVVRIWQRGTVEEVDGDRVTVKSEDGAEWKWTVDPGITVLGDGTSASGADALKKGDTIFVAGRLTGDDTRTAARVITGTPGDDGPGRFHFGGPPDSRHGGPAEEGRAS
ncbi:hypothetical protein ACI2L1_39060 [Streptomyces sp. NPDC019531]|uniref:hypothetical protein n=1 Tax=Streptomyces sp. NPDC019531 TaxID=3365062 RepID=UPI00384BDAA9